MKDRVDLFLLPLGLVAVLLLVMLAERNPGMLANAKYLGAVLALQLAVVGLSHFEALFFPMMMGAFLWAGSSLPYSSVGNSLRWVFLAAGAVGGFVIWMKRPRRNPFSAFHLVSFLCVLAGLASALVSEVPRIALLKVTSLFLLFLYAASGARLAISGREGKFVRGLVLVSEALVYISALCYFGLGFSLFGNPNALGEFIGVVAVPLLLWAALVAETRALRHRRFVGLAVCGILLYVANSRASILCVVTVILFVTMALHRQLLLLQCALASLFFFTAMAVINPAHVNQMVSSFTGRVVYKEQGNYKGVFGSRVSPWTETVAVVKRRPWFGSGFGTSELGELRRDSGMSSVYTTEGTNREHGSSYLAMAEYMGLLGALPFAVMLVMLLWGVGRMYFWMRRTRNPYHYAIPFALVTVAGVVHACFEDWLFAVGSYVCVFFWVSASLLLDMIPTTELGKLSGGRSTSVFPARSTGFTAAATAAQSLR